MKIVRRVAGNLSALVIAAGVAACGGDAAEDANTTTPPAAAPAAGEPRGASSDAATDYMDYRLSMPAVRNWYEAQLDIYRAMGENPELVDALDTSELGSPDELEAHFNSLPEVRDAASRAGLDMREYTLILLTLYHAKGIDEAIRSGADREDVIANRRINPANLEFIEQNRAELAQLDQQLEELEDAMQ